MGFVKICKLVPKSGEKNQVGKIPRKPENFKKLQNIQNWEKINFECKRVFYCILKNVLCKSLIVLIVTLLYCILYVYVELCTNRAFGSVKRYLTLPGT